MSTLVNAVMFLSENDSNKDSIKIFSTNSINNSLGIDLIQISKSNTWNDVCDFIGKYNPKFLELKDDVENINDNLYLNHLDRLRSLYTGDEFYQEIIKFVGFGRIEFVGMEMTFVPDYQFQYYLKIIDEIIHNGYSEESKDMSDIWVWTNIEIIIQHNLGVPHNIDAVAREDSFSNFSLTYKGLIAESYQRKYGKNIIVNFIEAPENLVI